MEDKEVEICKQLKEEEAKNKFVRLLKALKGKTIEDAYVDSFKEAGGIELEAVTIEFTDGSEVTFEQTEFADGCRGCFDIYPYLDVTFSKEICDDVIKK